MTQKIRFFVKKIKKNIWIFSALTALTLGLFLFYGYEKAVEETQLTEEEQESVRAYEQALLDYDVQIEEVQKSLDEITELTANLQNYVDHSIYMNLDPASVKQVSLSYRIGYAEGADAYNINTSLQTYPREGGLKESIENPEELETAYWDDVLSASINGNILTITFLHYDMEKAQQIVSVIKEKYAVKVPEIAAVWGGFSLTEINTAAFEKADLGIVNTQNSNRYTLMNYYNTKSDYVSKLNSIKQSKEYYKNNSKPEALKKKEKSFASVVLKWGIIGLLVGLFIGCVYVYLKEIVFVQDEELLYRELGLVVLGKMKGEKLSPEAERILEDFRLFVDSGMGTAIHFQVLAETQEGTNLSNDLARQMKEAELVYSQGQGLLEKTEDLKNALNAGCCIALVDQSKVTEKDLGAFLAVCSRYGIKTPGCILID